MSLSRVEIRITMHGDPSTGIMPITDNLSLQWDLDEMPGERKRVRNILAQAWGDLYDEGNVTVVFDDECPDCFNRLPYHKQSCPNNDIDY